MSGFLASGVFVQCATSANSAGPGSRVCYEPRGAVKPSPHFFWMKRLPVVMVFAFVLALVPRTAWAADPDPDPWLGADKFKHAGVSAALAAGGYTIGAVAFDARGHALLLGGGVALAAGVGKEVLDLAGLGDPSWKDLAWDVVGTVVGLAVAWSVDLVVRGVSDAHPLFVAPDSARPGLPAASSTSHGLRIAF